MNARLGLWVLQRTLLASVLLWVTSCQRGKAVEQPVAFSHRAHVAKKITCTFCHSGAARYSQASIPSVVMCMTCHSAVKADSPEIVRVKSFLDRGEEIPWRRLYPLPKEADVFFNHRRHAAAKVACDTCHGDVASQDRLHKEVEHTMGFCVRCHLENSAKFRNPRLAADCVTCHR